MLRCRRMSPGRSLNWALAYVLLGLPVPLPSGGEGVLCEEGFVACVVPEIVKPPEGRSFGVQMVCLDPGPCVPPAASETTVSPLVVEDLGSKALRDLLEADPADDDPKDVLVKGVPHATGGPGRHLMLRGKKDGAAATLILRRPLAGYFTTGILLSVQDTTGLQDEQSAAFFEVRALTDLEGLPLLYGLTATWDEQSLGFRVIGHDGDGPLGMSTLLPGPDVWLQVDVTADHVTLSADAAFAEGIVGYSFTDPAPPPLVAWEGAFGVQELGQKGTFFFDRLTLDPRIAGAGAEALAGLSALVAAQQLDVASSLAASVASQGAEGLDGLGGVVLLLEETAVRLEVAQSSLEQEEAAGRLHPTTQRKLALKTLGKTRKLVSSSHAKAEALHAKDSTKTKGLSKKLSRGATLSRLLAAQLHGYRGKSTGKLAADVTLPVIEPPPPP